MPPPDAAQEASDIQELVGGWSAAHGHETGADFNANDASRGVQGAPGLQGWSQRQIQSEAAAAGKYFTDPRMLWQDDAQAFANSFPDEAGKF